MKKSKHQLIAVDTAFHRKLKKEAAERGLKMIPYTKKLAEDSRTLEEKWCDKKPKKKRAFNIGL